MAGGKVEAPEIAKRLNFSDMDVYHASARNAGNSGVHMQIEMPSVVAHPHHGIANDIGIRQTHLNYQNIRRVFGELSENSHYQSVCKLAEEANLNLSGEIRAELQKRKVAWEVVAPQYNFVSKLNEQGSRLLQNDHPFNHAHEANLVAAKNEKKVSKKSTYLQAQEIEAVILEKASEVSLFEKDLAEVKAAERKLESILELERQAPPNFHAEKNNQDIDEEVEELEKLLQQEQEEETRLREEELQMLGEQDASDLLLRQLDDEMAELERSLSALEEEKRQAEQKAEAAKNGAEASRRLNTFVKLLKGMAGISLSKESEEGSLTVRIVTYLPPGGRRDGWPSQTRMNQVSHSLKIWFDDTAGEIRDARITPDSVPIDDIVEEHRHKRKIGQFVDAVRHRVKVTERRLALLTQAMKGGLHVDYVMPIIKVALPSGDILRLESSADWPLPRSTLRLVHITAAAMQGVSRAVGQERLIALMDFVNNKPDVERSELVPLVSFIESRLTHL